MRVPKDQGLFITIFMSVSLFVILVTWILLPPTISFEENEENVRVMDPEKAVLTAEEILKQAEESLNRLEEEKKEDKGGQGAKGGGKK